MDRDREREAVEQAELFAAVDRLVEAALEAEPSPDLAARVRRRIAEREMRRARTWPVWAAAAALAAALLAGLVVPALRRPAPAPPVAEQPSPPRTTAAAPPSPLAALAAASQASAPSAAPHAPARTALFRETPEVLVPPGQAEAIVALGDALRSHRVEPASVVPTPVQSGADIPEPEPLSVPPLETQPLTAPALEPAPVSR